LTSDSLKGFTFAEIAPEAGLSARALNVSCERKCCLQYKSRIVGAIYPIAGRPDLGISSSGMSPADRRKNIPVEQGKEAA
jgi:hypothetical protein